MAGPDTVKKDLAKILGKLESRAADGYGQTSFRAKAVGKSDDSIHLAVASGIISVPLKEIEAITPVRGLSDLEFQVEIRNGDQITYLRRVPDGISYPIPPGDFPDQGPFTWPPRVPPGGFPHTPPDGFPYGSQDGGSSTRTREDIGMDTSTTSGTVAREADQTDDHRPFYVTDSD